MENKFGNNLKQIRIKRKMTQADVAKVLNVSRSTYTYYETGKCEPNLKTIKKLAVIFKISINYLFKDV
ncbi:MAG: helix-turn-helix transcriptional regulator [Clostridia bacterium]